jgi:hypothetical protein
MPYSTVENKTFTEIHNELEAVWHSHYQRGEEYSDHIPFLDMVEKFAEDNFYNLHLIAMEYSKINKEFLALHLDDLHITHNLECA